MTKESIFLGIAGIVIGVAIYIKTQALLPALVPTLIGLALILFSNEEEKLEKRKDK
jgi:hypothetical protein